jgi:hypothetical protein
MQVDLLEMVFVLVVQVDIAKILLVHHLAPLWLLENCPRNPHLLANHQ